MRCYVIRCSSTYRDRSRKQPFHRPCFKRSAMGLYVFCFSFCKKGNLLSQWRAYAQESGVAVGLLRQHVSEKAVGQGFKVGAVHYYFTGHDDLGSWLSHRIEDLSLPLETAGSSSQRHSSLTRWICETAAFIKHPMFHEEAEWRCVKVADGTEIGIQEIPSRVSGSKVIPYVDLDLAGHDDG